MRKKLKYRDANSDLLGKKRQKIGMKTLNYEKSQNSGMQTQNYEEKKSKYWDAISEL